MMTQVRKKSRFVAVKEVEKALVEGIWKLVHIIFYYLPHHHHHHHHHQHQHGHRHHKQHQKKLTLFTKMIISIANLCLHSLQHVIIIIIYDDDIS